MACVPAQLRQKMASIIKNDYEECAFFTAATNMLTRKIQDIAAGLEKSDVEFESLRNEIGEIGLFISNAEKRLEEVEECYTRLVEALAEAKQNS